MEPIKRMPDTSVLPLDELWAKEAEDRLASYQRGEIKVLTLNDVLGRYVLTQRFLHRSGC